MSERRALQALRDHARAEAAERQLALDALGWPVPLLRRLAAGRHFSAADVPPGSRVAARTLHHRAGRPELDRALRSIATDTLEGLGHA